MKKNRNQSQSQSQKPDLNGVEKFNINDYLIAVDKLNPQNRHYQFGEMWMRLWTYEDCYECRVTRDKLSISWFRAYGKDFYIYNKNYKLITFADNVEFYEE